MDRTLTNSTTPNQLLIHVGFALLDICWRLFLFVVCSVLRVVCGLLLVVRGLLCSL